MNRVLLINKTKGPTREELTTSERRTGELLFVQFPELTYAGYVIAVNSGKKAANWIIPENKVTDFHTFARSVECDGYEVAVFANGSSPVGNGQCEVRVI
jgi:hypothetical protein